MDIMEYLRQYGGAVKDRVMNPGQTLATALKEGMPTEQNPLGMFGAGALTKGTSIYRGTKRAPDVNEVSKRFNSPGEEFGTHVSIDPNVADLMQYDYRKGTKGGVLSGKAGVNKPLVLPDTGGVWKPDTVAEMINRQAAEGTINFSKGSLNVLDTLGKEFKVKADTIPIVNEKEYNTLVDSYVKKMQQIIKKEGYDHISYENIREGNPSESAILFDRMDFTDPFKDTTR